jgi:hypothetical protein
MEIVERGEPKKRWPREFTTSCCSSVLLLEPGDILRDTDYLGDFNGYFINCPVCGSQPAIPGDMKQDGDRWQVEQRRIQEAQREG